MVSMIKLYIIHFAIIIANILKVFRTYSLSIASFKSRGAPTACPVSCLRLEDSDLRDYRAQDTNITGVDTNWQNLIACSSTTPYTTCCYNNEICLENLLCGKADGTIYREWWYVFIAKESSVAGDNTDSPWRIVPTQPGTPHIAVHYGSSSH